MWNNGERPGEVERISAKPYPWPRIDNYNPDQQPSHSATFTEAIGDDALCVLQVRGLGVITLRAGFDNVTPEGKLIFRGMSILNKSDIGYSPNI